VAGAGRSRLASPRLRNIALTSHVEIDGISKSFGAHRALEDVRFAVSAGSIHAVVGENGAGKSTLMKILAGVHRADQGAIRIAGRSADWRSPSDARNGGVSTVFQEFILVPSLSIAENLFLAREPRNRYGFIDRRAMAKASAAALARVGLHLDPDLPVSALSIGEQQMVEIARGVAEAAGIFIFDEPTAALNASDSEALFALLRDLRAGGRTIFYISHRMPEVFALADALTVLKDGRHVVTRKRAELTQDAVVTAMVGRPLEQIYPRHARAIGKPILEARELRSEALPEAVDLSVHAGEIVALAGLEGQGQRSLLAAIMGMEQRHSGKVMVDGRPLAGSRIADAIAAGIGFAPEDRKSEGLCLDLSIADNIRLGLIAGRPLARPKPGPLAALARLTGEMNLKSRSLEQPVGELSGGNQQKVMLSRWLARGVGCLICEEPTRGVDIGAKAEIYRLLRELADKGSAILISSRDLPEVIGLADRVAVMRQGRIVAMLGHAEASETAIMAAATGTTA
jgi:ribose transport system ATP-binding protein